MKVKRNSPTLQILEEIGLVEVEYLEEEEENIQLHVTDVVLMDIRHLNV